jgi:hypothetical protein
LRLALAWAWALGFECLSRPDLTSFHRNPQQAKLLSPKKRIGRES